MMVYYTITPVWFKLCDRSFAYCFGDGAGFFDNREIQFKIVDSLTYIPFENILIAIGSSAGPSL